MPSSYIPHYAQVNSRRKIAVYAGEGAKLAEITAESLRGETDQAVNPVCYIYADDIRRGRLLEDTGLLVFPGGQDRYYCRDLNGRPTDIIREFGLHRASLYFCAGGYFAGASMEYSAGLSPAIVEPRELALFPGVAVGAHCEFAGPYDGRIGTISAPSVRLEDGATIPLYYHGGCSLRPDPGHCFGKAADPLSAIGRFADLPGAPVCIARVNHEQGGKSILSGVHFELPGSYVHGVFSAQRKGRERMDVAMALNDTEMQRRLFYRSIVAECGAALTPIHQSELRLPWLEYYFPRQMPQGEIASP